MENLEKTSLLYLNKTFYGSNNNIIQHVSDDDIDIINYDDVKNDCAICFDEILKINEKILDCGHIFHKNCINDWTKINPICPYCRKYTNKYFDCILKNKYSSNKCKIFIDETKFSKVIINIYTFSFLSNKPIKQLIIPTTFVKCIRTMGDYATLYFKDTTKSDITLYKFKFINSSMASQFTHVMKNIFQKYYEFLNN
jgi:hypothetical protein